MSEAYKRYYAVKLEQGKLYQDFVVDACWSILGLAIVQYGSKTYQQAIGESRTGVEIKNDAKFAQTGNLWIECAERADQHGGPYVPSGIFRTDNTWLYMIGDYDIIFIFSKMWLQALYKSGKYQLMENNTQTSEGFLLTTKQANLYAAKILYPKAKEKINRVKDNLAKLGMKLHELAKANPSQLSLFGQSDE